LLKSEQAFKIYLTCLDNLGQASSISAAVQKRDELLASQSAVTATTDVPVPDVTPEISSAVDKLSTPPNAPLLQSPISSSSSQAIAQEVLSRSEHPASAPPSGHSTSKSPLSGETSQTNPIQVSIVESEPHDFLGLK